MKPSRPRRRSALALSTMLLGLWVVALPAATRADKPVMLNLQANPALRIGQGDHAPEAVAFSGQIRPQRVELEQLLDRGLHFRTGSELTVATTIRHANSVVTTLVGVHGQGTHVRYTGTWHGDAPGGFPVLVLTDGGRMTWEPEAHINFVMPSNFFTRQLWLRGDGTGTLELAEGFVSDRTEDATIPDAMGTIRLAGATLITHHSQSLPYNSRPDGRGGIYHNGHIVFEGKPASTWIVKTNQHTYSAQIDFDADGTINCQTPLTHNGQRRVCLPVGNGGAFVSSGAFRTTSPNVTITKTGPAMLSLEGQQAYLPGSSLIIEQGLVRIHTDPGAGQRVANEAGPLLHIEVMAEGRLHFAAPISRVRSIKLHRGATLSIEGDSILETTDGITAAAGATLGDNATIRGPVERQ